MADGPAGFHFDELNKVRVLEPEIGQQTQELKEECKEFVDSKQGCFIKYITQSKANILLYILPKFGYLGLKLVSTRILIDYELISYTEIGEFQKIVGGFIDMVDALAKEVEKEKMKVRLSSHLRCLYL